MNASEIFRAGIFFADAGVTGIAAWLVVCACRHGANGVLETGVAWGWSFVALIAGAGVVLGETGGFGPVGFLAAHAALAGLMLFLRRHSRGGDLEAGRNWVREVRAFFNAPGAPRLIALGLLFTVAALSFVAALAEPIVLDALTYRLPRIGHWLQDGRIQMLAGEDRRMNFVAVLPDVVAAWVLGATSEGFRLVVVTQAMGGILALSATVGLARQTGLTRCGSLLAGALLLGMANVVGQFTAAQTDLFATGLFAGAFYLWICALRRREVSVPGVAGAGLALGAKGTVFYLAPSALLWVVWLGWRHPMGWRQWVRTLVVAIAGVAVFAGPAFLRNARGYGGILGPDSEVGKHHRGFASPGDLANKLRWNLTSSLAQCLEPHSQPWGLRDVSRGAAARLIDTVPAHDAHALDDLDRHAALSAILQRREPDADVTSFGIVPLGLFLAGLIVAMVRWSDLASRLVGAWAGGVVVLLIFFHAMHQWHPYAARYLVLAAPWIAIVAAWGIEQLPPVLRRVAWSFAVLAAADVAWHITTQTHQSGWRSVVSPQLYREGFVARKWREWSEQLDGPIVLALPSGRPMAAFYRQRVPRVVSLVADADRSADSAATLAGDQAGWIIVPVARFMGREGSVVGRTWLFEGDPASPFSLAAYRRPREGEAIPAMLYRNQRERGGTDVVCELLVRAGATNPVRLRFGNPAGAARAFGVETPLGRTTGTLAGESTGEIEIMLPPDAVAPVRVIFGPAKDERPSDPLPMVQLVGP